MRELPRAAWERFPRDGDAPTLAVVVGLLPDRPPPHADYPAFHRLRDVELAGRAYRACRLAGARDGDERLFIGPTEAPVFGEEGVPYWLTGRALPRWVRDETEHPAKDEVDWEAYRPRR